VRSKRFSVVCGKDDDGVVAEMHLVQMGQDASNLLIDPGAEA